MNLKYLECFWIKRVESKYQKTKRSLNSNTILQKQIQNLQDIFE